MMSQARAEHWDFLTSLLEDGEIDAAEFRQEAAGNYAKASIETAITEHALKSDAKS